MTRKTFYQINRSKENSRDCLHLLAARLKTNKDTFIRNRLHFNCKMKLRDPNGQKTIASRQNTAQNEHDLRRISALLFTSEI